MNKYLKLYVSHSQYVNPKIRPNVSYCKLENEVHYNPILHDYSKDYFTIKSLDDNNTITFASSNRNSLTILVSSDDGSTWSSYTSSTLSGVLIAVLNTGEKILVKGNNNVYGSTYTAEDGRFLASKPFEVMGNIMSLTKGDSFVGTTDLSTNAFLGLFYQSTNLTSAENLILPTFSQIGCYRTMFYYCKNLVLPPKLPATTLANYCYKAMFMGCSKLITAPELPAPRLKDSCYMSMFQGCTSLTVAPTLSATTLAEYCYYSMFAGCTSLTIAPELPATTLANSCYYDMFAGCTNLNSITCFATNISPSNCTHNWVAGVAASGTFTKHPSMTGWTTGVNGIPEGWETADFVPSENYLTFDILSSGTIVWKTSTAATTAATISYSINGGEWTDITSSTAGTSFNVSAGDKVRFKGNNAGYSTTGNNYNTFRGSTASFNLEGNIMSLIDDAIFDYKTTLDTSYTFNSLFRNTNINNAENLILPAISLTTGCYYYMFVGCRSLTIAPELPATVLADSCYVYMFGDCTRLTTPPKLPATILVSGCYANMFANCTSLTIAPSLPAITLTDYCYESMFSDCTSLATAPELPATILKTHCYYSMFKRCTSLNYIKCLATDISAYDCTKDWVSGVSNSGSFITSPNMDNWILGVDGIPLGWTINGVLPPTALMRIWIDDFPSDIDNGNVQGRMEAEVSDPSGEGANPYLYYEETIDYNGNTYYLWKAERGYAAYNENSKYFVTTTVDFNTLYNQSLEDDLTNHFTAAIGIFNDSKGLYRAQNINPDGDDDHYLIKVEDLS